MKTVVLTTLCFLALTTLWVACKKADDSVGIGGTTFCTATTPFVYESAGGFVILPNAFTPNGDGKNDKFRPVISNLNITDFYMGISKAGSDYIIPVTDVVNGWSGTGEGRYEVHIHFKVGNTTVDTCNSVTIPHTDYANQCVQIRPSDSFLFEDQVNVFSGDLNFSTSEIACP